MNPFPLMHKLLLFVLLIAGALPLRAQDIAVEFTKNPEKPVVIENKQNGRALFFFYPERLKSISFAKEGNPCKAYEVDSKTLQVLRKSPDLALAIPGDNADTKIRILCSFSRGDDYFIALENSNELQVLRISGKDLSMTTTKHREGRVVNGVAAGTEGYVLCTLNSKKDGGDQAIVLRINDEGGVEKHFFPVGEKRDEAKEDLFRRQFRPLSVEYETEQDPESASGKTKLFAGDNKLFVTFDDARTGPRGSNSGAAILKVLVFDLATDSLHLKRLFYLDSLDFYPSREERNSFIYDRKIFQMYMNSDQFMLRVRDLDTGTPLFTKALLREDTIEGLANSPIMLPGRGLLGVEKEYKSVRKFVNRFSKFRPFIQVRRAGNDYLLCLGGYEVVSNNNPGFYNPAFGMVTGGGFYGSYEHAFSFYSAIDAQTLTRSPVFFKKSLTAAYQDQVTIMNDPPDQALIRIDGKFFLGYFDRGEKLYRLKKIDRY